MTEFVQSVCPHDCPSTCALEVERLNSKTIGNVRGAADNDFTDGAICAKVGRYAERVHHKDRLLYPLKRVGPKGSGQFERITWDEALETVAQAFKQAEAEFGKESVWPYRYAGTMGYVQRDGIERLVNDLGYSKQHKTICSTLASSGWKAGTGAGWGADPRNMLEADMIVFWGINPVASHINAANLARKARKERGTKIVSIDPYRGHTAKMADLHLAPRPGTDGALACAVMHVLFKEGYADKAFMAARTDVPKELERHLEDKTPAWASEITGLSEEEIVSFARAYGQTPRTFLRIGYGMSRNRNGAANVHAVSCLPAVTGSWKYRGGGAMQANGGLYAMDKTLIEGSDVEKSGARMLDMSQIGPILTGDAEALKGGGPVKAMLIQNCNPVTVAPESAKVREGFLRDDLFVCVHEQFMTETAQMADIVLPATTFLEHHDIYQGGGHVYLQAAKPVIDPPGECRSNHEVICDLAKRLGGTHRGFHMTAWDIIDETVRSAGLKGAEAIYRSRWVDCSKPFEQQQFLSGFGHPDGKFKFAPDWSAAGPDGGKLPRLPDHPGLEDASDEERPYRLVTAPARNFLNTSFTETETSRKQEKGPKVLLNSQDCKALNVTQGDWVRLGNERGDVLVPVEVFDGLQPGVAVVESIWPNSAFVEGRGINYLVSADPGAPNGGAVFHDTAVWIKAEGAPQ